MKVATLTTTGLGLATSLAIMVAPWGLAHAPQKTKEESAWVAMDVAGLGYNAFGTGTGLGRAIDTRASADLAMLVSELKVESGLTADQLGRLLGVSRRSIHNWAAGSAIASIHEERVRDLSQLVMSLNATTPAERRAKLLASNGGRSLFKEFAAGVSKPERVQFDIPVAERLGL